MSLNSNQSAHSLGDLPVAARARVLTLPQDDGHFTRLRAMGLCEGRCVQVIRQGSRMIVAVAGVRIGLHRALARRIEVGPA